MIKNVIFDCGQVLIKYNEVDIASFYTDNAADAEILGKVGMSRKYWELFDRGTLEEADYLEQVKKEIPEHLHTAVEKLSEEWIMRCPSMPGMEEIVCDVKKAGKKLYLLSNFNKRLRYEQHYIPALKHFDALVISGEIQKAKPDRGIYEYLLSTYNLNPEECIFIDDNPANIAMGESLGIKGYLFDFDVAKLREYLKKENLI
jgi:putative hydrolase of the HAD superfamily